MPTWFPAAYMKAPENICIHRIFCRTWMGPGMPWTVRQISMTCSQASTALVSCSVRFPFSAPCTAWAGRLSRTEGVAISVTLRQSSCRPVPAGA